MTSDRDNMSDMEKIEAHRAELAAKKTHMPPGGPPVSMPNFAEVEAAEKGRGPVQVPGGQLSEERYEELVRSKKAIPGVGGGYTVNQPGLRGEDSPDKEVRDRETAEGLKAILEANKDRAPAPEVPDEKPVVEEPPAPAEPTEDPLKKMPADTFSALNAAAQQRLKMERKRKEIESRLSPMSLEDILLTQDAKQIVPIVPGTFEVKFRSHSGEEDIWIKNYAWGATTDATSDLVYHSRMMIASVALGLVSVNGKAQVEHRDSNGDVKTEDAMEKIRYIMRFPIPVIAELQAQYQWFDERVRDLMTFESVKNG